MWIDTHTHFDAAIFDNTRQQDWQKAQALGVKAQFMMGIAPFNFTQLEQLATQYDGCYFALGIHPLFIRSLPLVLTIEQLKQAIEKNLDNPCFIGVGEIGLDGFVTDSDWDQQLAFFTAQLKLAQDYDLPVFMHVRKAQDQVLKYCRRFNIQKGIAHAFNGSEQQAGHYIDAGFKLGFGGAMTFERAKQLRRLIKHLPIQAFVLETDAPDMSPAWAYQQTNYSYHLPRIAEVFAQVRGMDSALFSVCLFENTVNVLPQMQALA